MMLNAKSVDHLPSRRHVHRKEQRAQNRASRFQTSPRHRDVLRPACDEGLYPSTDGTADGICFSGVTRSVGRLVHVEPTQLEDVRSHAIERQLLQNLGKSGKVRNRASHCWCRQNAVNRISFSFYGILWNMLNQADSTKSKVSVKCLIPSFLW